MQLSIVIPTKDRPEYLEKLLRSLYNQMSGYNVEIIVVDDKSKTVNLEKNRILCQNPNINLLEQNTPTGSGEARNRGIRDASSDWLAFLDDDVIPAKDWLSNIFKELNNISDNVVGIEGKVICDGNGLWDREVENLQGNLFLTANIIYKKKILQQAGLFDKRFLKYGEDQELAIRVQKFGEIVFRPSILVKHLPRKINFNSIIVNSFSRMHDMLNSEYLLYKKHPAFYSTIRYADTFWGTLKNTLLKHIVISLKRRSLKAIVTKPFQFVYFLASLILEEIAIIIYSPKFLINELTNNKEIPSTIDLKQTSILNGLTIADTISFIKLKTNLVSCFKRLIAGKRNFHSYYKKLSKHSNHKHLKILLRIDDIFLNDENDIKNFCKIIKLQNISFLAAVTLNDLLNSKNREIISLLSDSNAIISIHGIEHNGKLGAYPSEIIQLKKYEIENFLKLSSLKKTKAFIAPFNAITWKQIEQFSENFPIITGGPETGRFTDHISLPSVLNNGSLYIPSLPPFYSSSSDILKSKFISNYKGIAPITFHFQNEKNDNFKSLDNFINKYKDNFLNWNSLLEDFENV